jgi:hypothetical protein
MGQTRPPPTITGSLMRGRCSSVSGPISVRLDGGSHGPVTDPQQLDARPPQVRATSRRLAPCNEQHSIR